jgi:hypothetical protein
MVFNDTSEEVWWWDCWKLVLVKNCNFALLKTCGIVHFDVIEIKSMCYASKEN